MKMTHMFMLLVALALLLYDVYAYLVLGDGNTISECIWKYSKMYPILPLCGGILAAHFWWTLRGGFSLHPVALIILGLAFLGFNLYTEMFGGALPTKVQVAWDWLKAHQLVSFGIGMILGRYGWGQ